MENVNPTEEREEESEVESEEEEELEEEPLEVEGVVAPEPMQPPVVAPQPVQLPVVAPPQPVQTPPDPLERIMERCKIYIHMYRNLLNAPSNRHPP